MGDLGEYAIPLLTAMAADFVSEVDAATDAIDSASMGDILLGMQPINFWR